MFKFEKLISQENTNGDHRNSHAYTLNSYLEYLAYGGYTTNSMFVGLDVTLINDIDYWSVDMLNGNKPITLIYEFKTSEEAIYLAMSGVYTSINGLEMDDGFTEVFPKQVRTTIYTDIDGVEVA